jgi:hypothetical protein
MLENNKYIIGLEECSKRCQLKIFERVTDFDVMIFSKAPRLVSAVIYGYVRLRADGYRAPA